VFARLQGVTALHRSSASPAGPKYDKSFELT
jgi:hypothetical protein